MSKSIQKHVKPAENIHAERRGQPVSEFISKAPLPSSVPMAHPGCLKKIESLIEKGRRPKDIAEFVYCISEAGKCSDADFYKAALDYTLSKRDFDSAEDICQSAVIAHVNDEALYLRAMDVMLTPMSFVSSVGTNNAIKYSSAENACRILGSIALHNLSQSLETRIDVPNAFMLAVNRVWKHDIYDERRSEDRIDRVIEIYENALDAEIDPSTGYDLFEWVHKMILENKSVSKDQKVKQLFEVTAKTIRSKVSHTILFTKVMEFLEANDAKNQRRTLRNLLTVHKK
jgi:hypothetical protein